MYGISQSILFYAFATTFTFGGYLVEDHKLTYEMGKQIDIKYIIVIGNKFDDWWFKLDDEKR